MTRDLSSGLSPEKEQVVAACPDIPFWCENLLFAMYDPGNDLGLWFHLGTVPNDWTLWEDRVFISLPGDEGTLAMWSHGRSPPERRPGGPNLAFKCLEPFRRWKVTFDGFAQHVPLEAMAEGLAAEGRRRVVIDLDIECVTPVWDAHSTAGGHGKGGMESQGWAKEHYEQLYRATGQARFDDATYQVEAAGWRDHSRGPRDGNSGDPWGGHVIVGALFPSGRGAIFSRYWKPDGAVNLEGGIICEPDGSFRNVDLVRFPRLTDLRLSGERTPVELAWDGGSANFEIDCRKSVWIAMKKRVKVAKDLSGTGLMYVLNYGACELDGEVGAVYMERSDHLNALPKTVA
jgi:hypothetical protein